MKRINKLSLLLIGLIFLISCDTPGEITIDKDFCTTDADCVPSSCCHPTECVLDSEAPDCSDIFCSQECVSGTLDCGQGSCYCSDNVCVGVVRQRHRSII